MPSLQQRGRKLRRRIVNLSLDVVLSFVPGVSPLHLPTTPIPRLLETNQGPTDEQAKYVREVVAKALVEKATLEFQLQHKLSIGNLSATWAAATRHKIGRTNEYVQQHKAVLSPIKALPCEILQDILQCCAGHISSFSATCALESVSWNIGQVCRSWRRIALDTPTIWNVIPPGPLTKSPRRNFIQQEAVVELLRRSGAAPLHVFIYCEDVVHIKRHPVLEVLVQQCERWKLFSFEGPSTLLVTLQSIRHHIPSLEILKLRPSGPSPPTTIDYFKDAPRLHSVSLTDVDLSTVSLPLHQLTHYRERLVRRDLWLVALTSPNSTCPLDSLTTLDLANLTLAESITLPKLTRLTLRCHTHSCAVPSIPHLILPSIEAIRISASGESLVAMLAEMIVNSASSRPDGLCLLEDLYYRDRSFKHPPSGVLPQLLQSTTRLKTLDAPLPSAQDIQAIARDMRHDENPSLPLIRSCKFYVQGGDSPWFEDADCVDDLSALSLVFADRCTPDLEQNAQNLSLYFSQAECGTFLNYRLNKYPSTDESSTLDGLRMDLLERFASLRGGSNWNLPTPKHPDEDDIKKIKKKLEIINAFELVQENVEAVYRSGVHLAVKQVSECEINGTADLAAKAQTILDKWSDTFKNSLDLRKWAFRGRYELVYVPPNEAIRVSADALDLAYELRPVPYVDLDPCF